MRFLRSLQDVAIVLFILILASYVFRFQIGVISAIVLFSYSFGFLVVVLLGNFLDNFLKNRIVLRSLILFVTYLAVSRLAIWLHTNSILYLISFFQFLLSLLCVVLYDIFGMKNKPTSSDDHDSTSETNP